MWSKKLKVTVMKACILVKCYLTIFKYSKSAADDNVKSPKIKDYILNRVWNNVAKRRNCSSWAISSFATMFSNVVCCRCVKMGLQKITYLGETFSSLFTAIKDYTHVVDLSRGHIAAIRSPLNGHNFRVNRSSTHIFTII